MYSFRPNALKNIHSLLSGAQTTLRLFIIACFIFILQRTKILRSKYLAHENVRVRTYYIEVPGRCARYGDTLPLCIIDSSAYRTRTIDPSVLLCLSSKPSKKFTWHPRNAWYINLVPHYYESE